MNKIIFEKEEDNLLLDIPKEERYLHTSSYDYSVEFLVGLMQDDKPKIILEAPFQRKFIWKEDRCSQLIESIIMNVPIPPLYFAEEEDNRWLVVDGLQRLNSILKYFQNEYELKKLEILKELEKFKYKDLPPKAKGLLNDGLMRINVIKNDSHADIKYDIFMRLNKGSVILNYQELRNCLYRGHLNNAAREIVQENKDLLAILKLKEPHERFMDVEFVIRFFALSKNLKVDDEGNYCIGGYKGRMVKYINDFMRDTKIEESEKNEYKRKFNEVITKVVSVFRTELAFRDIFSKTTKVNKAMADFIMISFDKISLSSLKDNKNEIKALLERLLRENEQFRNSISSRTSDSMVLNYRINFWFKELQNVIHIQF